VLSGVSHCRHFLSREPRIAGRVKVRWIDNAAGRIDRAIGGLAMAGVFYASASWAEP
jgi:hypothetical protein